jgi:diguanylate cyclase (GGDEF)-like protein
MASSLKGALGLADSRFADELGRSVPAMTFPPDLEREYHTFFLTERRSHVRSFNSIMFALATCAFLASWLSYGAANDTLQRLRLGAIALAYACMLWAASSRHFQRVYLTTARLASLAIAILGSVEIAYRVTVGQGELLALLTTYSIGLYFLAGILYRAAVEANVVLVISFAVALLYLGQPTTRVAYLVAMLAATAAIGGLAFRHQGIRFRRSFLERGLIAELAARDGLTGLKNRRAFDDHLVRAWQQALRDRKPIVVMLIDVDYFKNFNDRYGHQAGDVALQRIAGVVNGAAKRVLDLAARYGGEEFALILYDVPREHATQLADALRAGVLDLRIEHLDGTPARQVTISVGVALVHPTLARSPDGVVQLADEALYAAKGSGRNRVEIFESQYDALATGTFTARL